MNTKSCCFTGHRNIPDDHISIVMRQTENTIRTLIAKGVSRYFVGGAIGYDIMAAQILFRLRDEFPQIKVVLAYPFDGSTSRWTEGQRAAFSRSIPMYDMCIRISSTASRGSYLARNRYMVDHSDVCISYCTHQSGGTAYTVRYAQKKGIPVFDTAPRSL